MMDGYKAVVTVQAVVARAREAVATVPAAAHALS